MYYHFGLEIGDWRGWKVDHDFETTDFKFSEFSIYVMHSFNENAM